MHKQSEVIRLEFDGDHLRVMMRLWRDSLDLKIPVHDEFKIHFMQNRGTILKNYESTAGAWLLALRPCRAHIEDAAKLTQLISDVAAFKQWAHDELEAIERMAVQTELENITGTPEEMDLLRRLAQGIRKSHGDDGSKD